jgi:Zn-dependent peptidase ImmA (M78 family)
MRLLILLLSLISCSEIDQTIYYRVDKRLSLYVDDFFIEANRNGVNLYKENLAVVITEDIDSYHSGTSSKLGSQRLVKINSFSYNAYKNDSIAIRLLIYHELGHALLNRRHSSDFSIMNTSINYIQHFKKSDSISTLLLKELFDKSKFDK